MTDESNETARLQADTTANTTWSAMLAGNRRFADGKSIHPSQSPEVRKSLENEQHPDAVVLACADSRVAPEIIFDAGLGEMFTVRNAGQVPDTDAIASIEFAVENLHPSLLVVLGHQHCAAIAAAENSLSELIQKTAQETGKKPADFEEDLDQVIDASTNPLFRFTGISVWQARMSDLTSADDYEQVHIAHTIEHLVTHSEIIRDAVAHDRLMLVGARYCMDTGLVEVLSF